MLGGTHRQALIEWLAGLASTNKRVREALLPSLLNFGVTNKEYREAILAVLGKRGVWLAAQNPEWSYVTSANLAEAVWQTGSSEERMSALQQIRKTDAAKALELLLQSWRQEAPQDRSRFIKALQINLTMDDEPFLESALDDKRKEVRSIAAELLATLPESRLVKRMTDRALPLLTYKSGLRARLEVKLPEECDKAMTRDGIESTSPYFSDKLGQKAYWLSKVLGTTPIDFWRQRWKLTTQDLLKLTEKTEWQQALNLAWFWSARGFQDTEMAEALLKAFPDKKKYLFRPLDLLRLLVANRREEIILEFIQAHGKQQDGELTASQMISTTNHFWSQNFTRAILDYCNQRAQAGESGWMYVTQHWVFFMETRIALEEFERCQPQFTEPYNRHFIDNLGAPLSFRNEMLAELRRED
jgi:hypothetical protein